MVQCLSNRLTRTHTLTQSTSHTHTLAPALECFVCAHIYLHLDVGCVSHCVCFCSFSPSRTPKILWCVQCTYVQFGVVARNATARAAKPSIEQALACQFQVDRELVENSVATLRSFNVSQQQQATHKNVFLYGFCAVFRFLIHILWLKPHWYLIELQVKTQCKSKYTRITDIFIWKEKEILLSFIVFVVFSILFTTKKRIRSSKATTKIKTQQQRATENIRVEKGKYSSIPGTESLSWKEGRKITK